MTDTDLIIVGGGIIGLAHARLAAARGLSVHLLEADHRPVGASVRNFGHACITGQTGEFASLAHTGRAHWLAAAAEAGFWAAESGAHVVADSPQALAVLEEAAEAGADIRLLTGAELASGTGIARADHPGGAFLPSDLRVDPRTAAPALTAHLAALPGVTVTTGERVRAVADGEVVTARGRTHTADHVIVCTGHQLPGILPDVAEDARMVECALTMTRVELPAGWSTDGAVLTRTSLLRYDAFAATAAAAGLRAAIAATSPRLLEIGANLMMAPLPDGTLLLGDSHDYDPTVAPFVDEDTTRVLLDTAARVLGVPGFRVRERWQGVYASSPVRPLVVDRVDARTTAVTVATGLGMTIGFGLAERTLDAL